MEGASRLHAFRAAGRRGFMFDFDGTLSEIVARPELARPVTGVSESLERLAGTDALVAVVSGRPASQVRELLAVPHLTVVGVYGLPEMGAGRSRLDAARADIQRASEQVPGAWVEDKGPSVAVHYRGSEDPAAAGRILSRVLRHVADAHELSLLPGKMVLELTGDQVRGKGAVVRDLIEASAVDACLYAGDDLADLDAFEALEELGATGVLTVKVAVRSEETPEEVLSRADVVVERPAGLVGLLSEL